MTVNARPDAIDQRMNSLKGLASRRFDNLERKVDGTHAEQANLRGRLDATNHRLTDLNEQLMAMGKRMEEGHAEDRRRSDARFADPRKRPDSAA